MWCTPVKLKRQARSGRGVQSFPLLVIWKVGWPAFEQDDRSSETTTIHDNLPQRAPRDSDSSLKRVGIAPVQNVFAHGLSLQVP